MVGRRSSADGGVPTLLLCSGQASVSLGPRTPGAASPAASAGGPQPTSRVYVWTSGCPTPLQANSAAEAGSVAGLVCAPGARRKRTDQPKGLADGVAT